MGSLIFGVGGVIGLFLVTIVGIICAKRTPMDPTTYASRQKIGNSDYDAGSVLANLKITKF